MRVVVDESSYSSFEQYLEFAGYPNLSPYTKLWSQLWHKYWEEIVKPLYIVKYWEIIDQYKCRDLVEGILEKFNFELIHNYMKMSGWTWHDEETSPKIQTLKSAILDLFTGIIDSPKTEACSSSGGFYVTCTKQGNLITEIKIEFKDERDGADIHVGYSHYTIKEIRAKKLLRLSNH